LPEDGRAISCGFEERWSFSSAVLFSTTSFLPARLLCLHVGHRGYGYRTTMVAGVKIQFFERPTDNEIHFMSLAAQKLTKDPFTVEISKSDDLPNIATAIFRMKNESQYKVVDRVALAFKRLIPLYRDMVIWFEQEKAYDLRNRTAEQ
jgi:hypothetical protein